ncbi:MAG: hypothetical protein QOH30_1209 [Baekduia sp.]|nr:hypothetical protein [Baekduia sp.]
MVAQFDAEKITDRFFGRYASCHAALEERITGLGGTEARRRYASLLLHRLMFVTFLEKRGFLHGDRAYLRTSLDATRRLRGPDAFYRELLLPLFHHGLGSREQAYPDAEIAAIVGEVPYVGGGLFEEHELEQAHTIGVADRELERVLDLLDAFTWHLGARPAGEPDAVDPGVIGAIFERYVNLTSTGQKQGGAYYTNNDVTGYMAGVTLVPRLLERIAARCGIGWARMVREEPARYVPAALLHGRTAAGRWRAVPQVPGPPDRALQLADESWIETLDRRAHADRLLATIAAGEVRTVDDLISHNLDARALLADVIGRLRSAADVTAAWEEVTATTVIDPTCGSGAFLFAALGVLDEVYGLLLTRAREEHATGVSSPALRRVVDEADRHPNDAYARRRHAVLHNLHGLDLMPEALEIAKVRLFLALASTLEARGEIEPLPDLDDILRAGNLLLDADVFGDVAGGFDVVLGNPPFIARGRIGYAIDGYATAGLPDVYAPCVERALELLAPAGRFAMVLPIAFQFSAGHAAARRVVLEQGSVWVATFSRNPSALFTSSVGVRPIIVATSPQPGAVRTTATRRWQAGARGALFDTLRYAALPAEVRGALWLPRTGDDEVAALLMALTARGARVGTRVVRGGDFAVGFKAFALYYLPVYTTVPPVYDAARRRVAPPADKSLSFATREDQLLAFALMAGELGLLWWMSTADDFNLGRGTMRTLPIGLEQLDGSPSDELLTLAERLETELHREEHLLFTPYNGLMTGSWDLRRVREHSRAFDAAALDALGLGDYREAVLRAAARFGKSTGERNGTRRGVGWLAAPAQGNVARPAGPGARPI